MSDADPTPATQPSWFAASVRWIIAAAIEFCLNGIEFYGWLFRVLTVAWERPDD